VIFFLLTRGVYIVVFFVGYGAGIDDISDWFLREKIREDTYIVVRDRKVSAFTLILHPLQCKYLTFLFK